MESGKSVPAFILNGRDDRFRTCGLKFPKLARCQLRHIPIFSADFQYIQTLPAILIPVKNLCASYSILLYNFLMENTAVSGNNEVYRYRRQVILFLASSFIYAPAAFLGVLSAGYPAYRFDILNFLIIVIFFIPFLLISFNVFGRNNKIKQIFKINKEHKIRDIIQIICMLIIAAPASAMVLWLICCSLGGCYEILKLLKWAGNF